MSLRSHKQAKTVPVRPKIGRKGAATRGAILRSAVIAFGRLGYDGAGVREIAKGAKVTAMLVNRYFGSKEQLFAEAVDAALANKGALADDLTQRDGALETLAHDVAAGLVARTEPGEAPLDGFALMLRSASNERAAAILRAKLRTHFDRPLAALLPGARATERAALFLSVIAGFRILRQIVGTRALTRGKAAVFRDQLTILFQTLIDPPARPKLPPRKDAGAADRQHSFGF